MYEYKCSVIKVVDGNTVDAYIDLGFNILIKQRIKLYGIITPDLQNTDESIRNKAVAAKARLLELLGKEFICATIMNKRSKAGRILGNVYIEYNDRRIDVNQTMIDEGFAVPYGD